MTVFGPSHFYPLGPQMAAQLFRLRANAGAVDRAVDAAIGPDTYIVHWYNDNLKCAAAPARSRVDPGAGRRQMFSRLARPFLSGGDPETVRSAAVSEHARRQVAPLVRVEAVAVEVGRRVQSPRQR